MIIAVTSLKGGVGKTTTSVLLAETIANSGKDVILLDSDPEKSAKSWELLAERDGQPLSFTVTIGEADGLVKQARDLKREGKWVVIDTPPNDKSLLMSSAGAADLAIIPLAPTRIDLDRLGRTLAVLADMREMKPDLEVNFLLTMFARATNLSRSIAAYLENHRLFETKIRHLERYRRAFGTKPEYLMEYQALWKEIQQALATAA